MTKFRIILIQPEYELNVGAIARLMKNFNQGPLYIVRPDVHFGFTTDMHAKHAKDVLKKAKICKSIEEATRGCSMIVGTTGVMDRHPDALRHPMTLEQFAEKTPKTKNEVAILFGREGVGLRDFELRECDLLVTIPTSKRYPVMNLSHSVAVVLYELCARKRRLVRAGKLADAKEAQYLKKTIDHLVDLHEIRLNNPQKIKTAFRRVIGRSIPDDTEVKAMLSLLKILEKNQDVKNNQIKRKQK
jgi:tRNA/rRNA methyltransferase